MAQQTLEDRILSLMGSAKYQPLDKVDLSHALDLPPSERNQLRGTLRELTEGGQIILLKKNRYALPKIESSFIGRFDMNARGFGFVISENPDAGDLFIAAEHTGVAMNGDRVEARLRRSSGGKSRGGSGGGTTTEGEIVRVITRANTTLVGTFQRGKSVSNVLADDPRILLPITIVGKPDPKLTPQPGDKVVVELDEWTKRYESPTARLIEVLGPSDAPGVDMLSIIRKYRLPVQFPDQILAAAERFPTTVPASDAEGREDLRDFTIFTIDPDDARDFDDAICIEQGENGWQLGVHIADVSHYVTPGSDLDREAWERGNSTYLPDRVLPMLPERLSNGLCSLRPDEDRLTFTVWMRFNPQGKQLSASFSRSIIRSAKRLTYQEAFAILEGHAHSPVENDILEAWTLAALLRKNRFAAGSLDLDFPEVKVRVDNNGRAIALEKVEHDRSHQLIEEFMLQANETVAREIKQRTIPSIYRIHEKPDPDKLAEYRETLALAGYRVGDLTIKGEVQKLLTNLAGKPDEPVLKIGLLRSLKRATYDVRALGHYGLAKANYTHFTSPIRRYADLVVHRVLGAMIDTRVGKIQPSAKDLAVTAEHISTTERVSADAEREATKLKKLEYFSLQLDLKNPDHFTGLISDVKNYGLVVELIEFSLTGLVHVSDLTDDYFQFDPVRRKFSGKRTQATYEVGQTVQLIVSRVDKMKNQIDFRLAANPAANRDSVSPRSDSRPANQPSPRPADTRSANRTASRNPSRPAQTSARASNDGRPPRKSRRR